MAEVRAIDYTGSERLTMNMGPQHPSAHGDDAVALDQYRFGGGVLRIHGEHLAVDEYLARRRVHVALGEIQCGGTDDDGQQGNEHTNSLE